MDRQHRIAAAFPLMASMHSPICSEARANSTPTKNSRFTIAYTLSRLDVRVKPLGYGKLDIMTEHPVFLPTSGIWFKSAIAQVNIGSKRRLRAVEVANPPRIMIAMGLSISRPGAPLPSASGSKPKPVTRAVIKIGRQPLGCTTQRRLQFQVIPSKLHQMLIMGDQHDGIADGNSKQSNEAD